ncbi:alpha/beta hydrolase [Nitrincola schmidtii]|uniref:alpha/beta hydrolase n=1 Tax=Nitrincola schmidtii TaxID=1730894 RepID=UPI00124C7A50|nr:dienelactone hydrolase family protein [Nitrincola schmidtii]
MLPNLTLEPKQPADSCVIWLHGLGADGHDFAPVVPELNLPVSLATRFIFPHAPEIPVTINGGMVMPAWYDILEMQLERKIDIEQLNSSADEIVKIINQQIDLGIPAERIIVAGFSQGGAVAYQVALSFPEALGGLLALSTYFATEKTIRKHPANQNIPILIMHGSHDDIVPESLGTKAKIHLTGLNYKVDYVSYPMPHSVCLEQIKQIGKWFQNCLKIG